jgi:hypothetical protein
MMVLMCACVLKSMEPEKGSLAPPPVLASVFKNFFPPCKGSVSAVRRYFRGGNVKGEAHCGAGEKGSATISLGQADEIG